MAKITRLPSGSYHTLGYAGKDGQGKRKYKSITADSQREVKRLAAELGLRAGEAIGLKWEDVTNTEINIRRTRVYADKRLIEKAPKSYAGTRTLVIPDKLYNRLMLIPEAERKGAVTSLEGYHITERFYRLLKQNGLPHYRFHDLRHYFASVMCALNIPAKYAAARMGHANEHIFLLFVRIMQLYAPYSYNYTLFVPSENGQKAAKIKAK